MRESQPDLRTRRTPHRAETMRDQSLSRAPHRPRPKPGTSVSTVRSGAAACSVGSSVFIPPRVRGRCTLEPTVGRKLPETFEETLAAFVRIEDPKALRADGVLPKSG